MATLDNPHWEALTKGGQELLRTLGRLPVMGGFYLAGGTGLALRLGHRISVDLDLFANIETLDDMVRHRVVAALEAGHKVERLQDSVLGLVLNVDGQACSFFSMAFHCLHRLIP